MAAQSYFLSDDDLQRITCKVQKGAQVRKLREMGIPFEPDAEGKPLVARAFMDQRFGVITTSHAAANSNNDGFRLD